MESSLNQRKQMRRRATTNRKKENLQIFQSLKKKKTKTKKKEAENRMEKTFADIADIFPFNEAITCPSGPNPRSDKEKQKAKSKKQKAKGKKQKAIGLSLRHTEIDMSLWRSLESNLLLHILPSFSFTGHYSGTIGSPFDLLILVSSVSCSRNRARSILRCNRSTSYGRPGPFEYVSCL